MEILFLDVCKELKIPCAVAAWIGSMILKTDEQAAKMAVWLWDNRERDVQKLLAKAEEIAAE
jgi:hypothetical protein